MTPPKPQLRLVAADRALLDRLEAGFQTVRDRAGTALACAPGCADCCHRAFPITRLDAWRLRRGLRRLAQRQPDRVRELQRRARIVAEALAAAPREADGSAGHADRLSQDAERMDAFLEALAPLPCPALDPDSQTCQLYEHRPVACRTFGPPLRFGSESAPHCELCFREASPAQIEACRWQPDPQDAEGRLGEMLQTPIGEAWHSFIAWVLEEPIRDWPQGQGEPRA